jgi:hypothetical protein
MARDSGTFYYSSGKFGNVSVEYDGSDPYRSRARYTSASLDVVARIVSVASGSLYTASDFVNPWGIRGDGPAYVQFTPEAYQRAVIDFPVGTWQSYSGSMFGVDTSVRLTDIDGLSDSSLDSLGLKAFDTHAQNISFDEVDVVPVFENSLQPGSLSVIKTVEGDVPEDHEDDLFRFKVRLMGENVPDTLSYEVSEVSSSVSGVFDWLCGLFVPSVAYADGELVGDAYAVLDSAGTLTFFRSTNSYTAGVNRTVTDVAGNSYTGQVYAGFENVSANTSS